MLTSLHIKNFAIIDELDLELASGMTALTGETGAGKSIMLDAISLLLGDRADAGAVKHGCKRAELSALFDVSHVPQASSWLVDQSLDQGNECQLRRVIQSEGRSRAFINGSPVPAQSLRELGELLVDIHGQHEHQSLMKRSAQRQLLDSHGKHKTLLEQLRTSFTQWQDCDQKIARLLGKGNDKESRLEFLRFQSRELDELALSADEFEKLHDELKRLSNSGGLLNSCETSLNLLYDSDEQSAHTAISKTLQEIASLIQVDPSLASIDAPLKNALILIEDAADQIRAFQESVTIDPERLQWVENRIDNIHSIARKHRVEADKLVALHTTLVDELQQLEQADEILQALEIERDAALQEYNKLARKLHNKRKQTAKSLSDAVTVAMQELGMNGGHFQVDISKPNNSKPSIHGTDQIEFLVSANPGQPPKPITKVASGGELSRISLAIQVIAAKTLQIPTLIFDEVDSGVGGSVAETVGNQLRSLGKDRQVICVTHLPQVAAQAQSHLQVSKLTGDKTTRTSIRQLSNDQRVEEIARMLGGKKITQSTMSHAEEMLQQ